MRAARFAARHPRPEWWPEDEAWPPHRPPAHRPLARRVLPAVFFVLIMAAASVAGLISLFRGGEFIRRMHPGGMFLMAAFGLGVVFVVGFLLRRGMRRFITPLDDLIQASRSVAEGDMTVRVRPRGGPEMRMLAESFNRMVEQIQAQSDQRQDMLADVTHELRTPLTIIQGTVEGMQDGIYPADEEHLGDLLNETQRLAHLIDDLRTLSLSERGALPIKRETTDMIQLASEALASFQPQAEEKGISLDLKAADDLAPLHVDPLRIRQVLDNLIANALHACGLGDDITITIASEEKGICLTVADTGAGIAPDDLPHIFERFYKSSSSGGSGLGLAIARDLVRGHGGILTVESMPGEGSTFCIHLPRQGMHHAHPTQTS